MYLGRREVHLLLGLGLVLAVGGRRGEVPGDRLVCYHEMGECDGQGGA